MFDIAWSELLVIVVVAVVVVGPKDLPRLMRTAGQWAGRARAMADQFRRSFDDMAKQSELDELRREVQKLKASPMSDDDYRSFGIDPSSLAPPPELTQPINFGGTIEEVGAAPPKLDPPAVSTAPATSSAAAVPAPSSTPQTTS